jgi:hypothetical protein
MRILILALLVAALPLALQSQALPKLVDYTMEYSATGGALHGPATLRQLFESGNFVASTTPEGVTMKTVVTKRTFASPYTTYLLTTSAAGKPYIQLTLKFLTQPDDESVLLVYLKVKVLANGQMQEMTDDGTQETRVRMAGFFVGITMGNMIDVDKLNALLDGGE